MEKAMYPSPFIRITQRDHEGTHADSWAIDEAGSDGGIDYLVAPFTGVVKKIYTKDANEVWLESIETVKFADGTEDYMTAMFAHDNDVSNLFVGQIISQGERFYEEGTRGQATGNHVHMEFAKGKFSGSGWHQNSAGYWSIDNGKGIDECVFIDDTYNIIDSAGYNFKNVKDAEPKYLGTPVARNEKVNQVRVFDETTVLRARNNPNGDVLGYINPGTYNLLERTIDGDYEWFKVEENLWFAYNPEWCEYFPKNELTTEESPDDSEQNTEKTDSAEELQRTVEQLQSELAIKDAEIAQLVEQLENAPKLIFESPKLDYYAIKLNENDKLYIGK